jgi:hypothetical protein
MSNMANELEYYIDRKPTAQEISDAEEWQTYNPGVNLDEYVSAVIEIGAL